MRRSRLGLERRGRHQHVAAGGASATQTMTIDVGRRLWVVLALSLGPAVSNSFARFAYALLLPAMRAELDLNYSQAGWLNTANALGYLAGAAFTVRYVSRLGNRRLFCVGMVVTTIAIIGSGLTSAFILILALRMVAGITGAMVFICGGVLASNLFPDQPHRTSTAIAIYFGGGGAGILLSGAGIPWLLETEGDPAWANAWLIMGAISALFTLLAIWAARRIVEPASGARRSPWPASLFRPALGSYFLFGVGYIAYMTFVVAWMVSHGSSALDVSLTSARSAWPRCWPRSRGVFHSPDGAAGRRSLRPRWSSVSAR